MKIHDHMRRCRLSMLTSFQNLHTEGNEQVCRGDLQTDY